jgi:hypothetical protein
VVLKKFKVIKKSNIRMLKVGIKIKSDKYLGIKGVHNSIHGIIYDDLNQANGYYYLEMDNK